MKKIWLAVRNLPRSVWEAEPAVVIGVGATIVGVVQQLVDGAVSPSVAIPAIVGLVIRQFVSPALAPPPE